jgi:hypothetical protein
MDTNVIITIAQAIIANTKVLQTLVDSLPKDVQAKVAVAAQVPVTVVAPVVAVPVVAPVVAAPVVAAPVVAAPVADTFASKEEMTAFVMDTYKALGPIKGAGIQQVLASVGVKNLNEITPDMYAAIKAGVSALRG